VRAAAGLADGAALVTEQAALSALPPRIRRMLTLLLKHQEAICEPSKGELTLHFNGGHVSAHLTGRRVLDNDEREPPGAA
jgi:hypothetical protein